MVITLEHYLVVSVALFCIGVVGALTRRNMLVIIMSIELMLVAANIALVAFARWHLAARGQLVALFVLGVAAGGVALGLGIVVAAFRNKQSLSADDYRLLKG